MPQLFHYLDHDTARIVILTAEELIHRFGSEPGYAKYRGNGKLFHYGEMERVLHIRLNDGSDDVYLDNCSKDYALKVMLEESLENAHSDNARYREKERVKERVAVFRNEEKGRLIQYVMSEIELIFDGLMRDLDCTDKEHLRRMYPRFKPHEQSQYLHALLLEKEVHAIIDRSNEWYIY